MNEAEVPEWTDVEPETKETKQEVPKQIKPEPLAVEKGMMIPKTAVELKAMVRQIAAGGGFPNRFKTDEQRLAAYNLAQSLMGTKWQMALNYIAPIHGQMSIFGELPGALAEQTGEVEEKHVYCIDTDFNKICLENKNLDAEPYAGVCIIRRKGREKKEFTYTINEAKKAGQYPPMKKEYNESTKRPTGRLIPNPDSPWEKFTKLMLERKAMNIAVRFEFPDAVVGVPITETDFDQAPDLVEERDVTSEDNADKFNKMF